jgi:hypothetical protein
LVDKEMEEVARRGVGMNSFPFAAVTFRRTAMAATTFHCPCDTMLAVPMV